MKRSFGWKDMVSDTMRCHDGSSFSPWLTDPTEAPSRLSCGAYACWLDCQELQGSYWRIDLLVGLAIHQLQPPHQEEQLLLQWPPAYRTENGGKRIFKTLGVHPTLLHAQGQNFNEEYYNNVRAD